MHVWFEKHCFRSPVSNPLCISPESEASEAQVGEGSSLGLGAYFWAPCYSLMVNIFPRKFEKKNIFPVTQNDLLLE